MSCFGTTSVVKSWDAWLTYSRGQITRPGIDTKWWGENVLVLDCQVCKREEIEEFVKLVVRLDQIG